MTQSVARTLVIPARGDVFLQWQVAKSEDHLDYYLDVQDVLEPGLDQISSVAVSIAPSGDGELSVSGVNGEGYLVSMYLTSGVPGRVYRVKVDVGTLQGKEFSWIIVLPIDLKGSIYSQPVAPDPGFGAPSEQQQIVSESGVGFWRLEDDAGNWAWG